VVVDAQDASGLNYTVDAPAYDNYFGHSETRREAGVSGTYFAILPDGNLHRVNYTVGPGTGFVATYEVVSPDGVVVSTRTFSGSPSAVEPGRTEPVNDGKSDDSSYVRDSDDGIYAMKNMSTPEGTGEDNAIGGDEVIPVTDITKMFVDRGGDSQGDQNAIIFSGSKPKPTKPDIQSNDAGRNESIVFPSTTSIPTPESTSITATPPFQLSTPSPTPSTTESSDTGLNYPDPTNNEIIVDNNLIQDLINVFQSTNQIDSGQQSPVDDLLEVLDSLDPDFPLPPVFISSGEEV